MVQLHLLAEGFDPVVIFWVVIGVLWLLKIFRSVKAAVGKPVVNVPPGDQAGLPENKDVKDIEDFLRHAFERLSDKNVDSDSEEEMIVDADVVEIPEKLESELQATQVVGDGGPLGRGLEKHLEHHVDTSQIARHTAQMGQEVAEADEQMEAHIHEKFDHQIGTLKSTLAETPIPQHEHFQSHDDMVTIEGTSGKKLASLLKNRDGMRRAIVLSEILNRPEDRWQK